MYILQLNNMQCEVYTYIQYCHIIAAAVQVKCSFDVSFILFFY